MMWLNIIVVVFWGSIGLGSYIQNRCERERWARYMREIEARRDR